MTIYDVPVDDTKFFPVSGDMMSRMKFEEEQRKKNGTGNPAKSSPDAADPNHYREEQIVKNTTPNDSREHDRATISVTVDNQWTVIDAGTQYLGTTNEQRARIAYELHTDKDERIVTVYRDAAVCIGQSEILPEVPPVDEAMANHLIGDLFHYSLEGKLRGDKPLRLTVEGELQSAIKTVDAQIEHPHWCERESCWSGALTEEPVHRSKSVRHEIQPDGDTLEFVIRAEQYADGLALDHSDADGFDVYISGGYVDGSFFLTAPELDDLIRALRTMADKIATIVSNEAEVEA